MQWEYKTIVYRKSSWLTGSLEAAELETILNELGRERWELVSAANNGPQRGLVLILKKPR
jgi:uncharacterized protein DUF4177